MDTDGYVFSSHACSLELLGGRQNCLEILLSCVLDLGPWESRYAMQVAGSSSNIRLIIKALINHA
jgi:hypothetical protein